MSRTIIFVHSTCHTAAQTCNDVCLYLQVRGRRVPLLTVNFLGTTLLYKQGSLGRWCHADQELSRQHQCLGAAVLRAAHNAIEAVYEVRPPEGPWRPFHFTYTREYTLTHSLNRLVCVVPYGLVMLLSAFCKETRTKCRSLGTRHTVRCLHKGRRASEPVFPPRCHQPA